MRKTRDGEEKEGGVACEDGVGQNCVDEVNL
jgi:hypothetical protein